ncbi:hypothetical protein BOTBODRAFT_60707 [Botryobasidium botryosum FD-172 SS1]|uniref:Peptide hydrolase n=1 Tax=Botryobasidium botryosum (strain FD-172 SS1) TaxID=930990 RepID=A0A067LVG0_BOTB1|nr:hypothetical protein BOTBODRAFT_60707 [Botryobasidium botryosum FD-172 SS1]
MHMHMRSLPESTFGTRRRRCCCLLAAEAYAYPSHFVLVIQSATAGHSECLSSAYFGSYGRPVPHKVYFPAESCYSAHQENSHFPDAAASLLDSGTLLRLSDDGRASRTLFWIQEAGIDGSMRGDTPLFSSELDRLARLTESISSVLYHDPANALVSIPSNLLPHTDVLLPRLFMRRDIRWLTGEDGAGPTTRRSWSKGARDAADWIQNKIEQTRTVISSVHYNSTADWFDDHAPGANDDGPGVLLLFAAARAIHRNHELEAAGTNVTIMVQADELVFHSASEQMQVGFPRVESLLETTYLVGNITNLYSPELKVGFTLVCCSDQQVPFERAGAILDPFYHKSGDFSDHPGYDFNQFRSIAKATLATMLEVAGFDIEE